MERLKVIKHNVKGLGSIRGYFGLNILEKLNTFVLKMVSLIYFIVSEINILIKFRYAICYTIKINCKSFEKMHGFPINMQWKIIFRIKRKLPFSL